MLTIVNRGACPRRAIELIGFTDKDGQNTVGQFGSGTSYAVALALRERMTVRISSHDKDGPYVMEPWAGTVTVGDRTTERISWRFRRGSSLFRSWWDSAARALSSARSIPTSFTTDLGQKDWAGVWPVVREFVSNARDADPMGWYAWYTLNGDPPELARYLDDTLEQGYDAVTVVQLEEREEPHLIEATFKHWFNYFRWDRAPVIPMDRPQEVFRQDEFTAAYVSQSSEPRIFIKGVWCPLPKRGEPYPKPLFDYSLLIGLTESRTVQSPWDVGWRVTRLWDEACLTYPDLAINLLKQLKATPKCWEAVDCGFNGALSRDGRWAYAFQQAFGVGSIVGQANGPDVIGRIILPSSWADALTEAGVPSAASRVVRLSGGASGPRYSGGVTSPNDGATVGPSGPDRVVFEMNIKEARRMLAIARRSNKSGIADQFTFINQLEVVLKGFDVVEPVVPPVKVVTDITDF